MQISSGKAYIRGYEVDKISTTSLDVLKPRTTKLVENQSVPIRMGKSVEVTHVLGSPSVDFASNSATTQVSFLINRLTSEKAATSAATFTSTDKIGTAKVYDYKQKSSSGIAVTTYDLSIYDVQLYTYLTISKTIDAVYCAYTRVEGKYSGAVGYSVSGLGSVTNITLADVTGQFQLNEPLIINGITEGNMITAIKDYNFEDIKAVHSSTGLGAGSTSFAANTVLNRKKQVFSEGVEFVISGGNALASAQVADFRSQLNIGDIITYGTAGQSDPTFNKVTSVSQNTVGLAAVADVTGVCDGSVNNETRSGLSVVIPTLNESDDPGFRVKLKDNYVASANVLDSSYIIRKQMTNSVSNNAVTFILGDHITSGDTSNLFLEPFNTLNYVLEVDNEPIRLLDPMVTVDTGLKQVVITGLPNGTPTAKLTVAVRRSKLVSKEKSLTRCSNLIVDRSESVGSGTTIDGLTTSTVYGTRVQDKELSLDVPEVTRVLAVLESNDNNAPDLPLIGVTNQSDTFTNNVIVGEQFIGGTSGAIARVVVPQATQLSFVYENENTFEVGENISLKTSGIFATITGVTPGDRNILKNFDLDNGQRVEFADFSRLIRKSNVEKPTRKLRVIFDNLVNDETSGTVSYTHLTLTTNREV
mgnify:CR=1 FL=1